MPSLCVHGPTWSRCSRRLQWVAKIFCETLGAQILLSYDSDYRTNRVLQVSHHFIRLLWPPSCDLINVDALMEQRSARKRRYRPDPTQCHGAEHRFADSSPALRLHVQCALAVYSNFYADRGHLDPNILQAVP